MVHDKILTNGFLHVKRGTRQMRIAVSREQTKQRAGELLAHTYVPILERYTFSIPMFILSPLDLNLVLNLVQWMLCVYTMVYTQLHEIKAEKIAPAPAQACTMAPCTVCDIRTPLFPMLFPLLEYCFS